MIFQILAPPPTQYIINIQHFWRHNVRFEACQRSLKFGRKCQNPIKQPFSPSKFLAKLSLRPKPIKKTLAKFGTIGFVRLKCIKSRSFVAFEAAFHDEIFNLGLIGLMGILFFRTDFLYKISQNLCTIALFYVLKLQAGGTVQYNQVDQYK